MISAPEGGRGLSRIPIWAFLDPLRGPDYLVHPSVPPPRRGAYHNLRLLRRLNAEPSPLPHASQRQQHRKFQRWLITHKTQSTSTDVRPVRPQHKRIRMWMQPAMLRSRTFVLLTIQPLPPCLAEAQHREPQCGRSEAQASLAPLPRSQPRRG